MLQMFKLVPIFSGLYSCFEPFELFYPLNYLSAAAILLKP
jgi:hypothetical protein